MDGMATELDNRCLICLDSSEEASYVMPCLHQFCYPCIMQWAESKTQCPICKRRILSIAHSVQTANRSEEHVISPPAAPSEADYQSGGAPGYSAAHSPAATEPPVGLVLRAPPGGLQPHNWAFIFQNHPPLLQLLLPWVHHELGSVFGNQHSLAEIEDHIMNTLILFGLDVNLLVQVLGTSLQNHTVTFVHQLVDVAVQRCSMEAHRMLGLGHTHTAGAQGSCHAAVPSPAATRGGSPVPSPAPPSSPDIAEAEMLPSTSSGFLHWGPSNFSNAPIPTHEEQMSHKDPEEAAPGLFAPHQGREGSCGRPQRALKRRASTLEGSSPAVKRRPCQQH